MSTKIAIIGAGGMAHYHVTGFRQAGAEVVALTDLNKAAADQAAAKHGIGRVFSDVATMLREVPELDAVSVIVPNKFHAPLTIQALRAGKHVFCEKPPTINAREMTAVAAAAAKSRRLLMFNFNNRARYESYAMADYLAAGEIGRINSCRASWFRRTGIPGFGGWFTTRAMAGGGPLIDLLHMIDLGVYFMGNPRPEYVLAQTFNDFITDKTFKGPWGIRDVPKGVTDVESAAHGFVRFATGQVMSFQVSWAEMNKREECSLVFQGTKAGGMIQRLFAVDGIDDTSIDTCELYTHEHGRPVNRTVQSPADPSMGRVRSAMNFVRAIEGTEKPLNTPDEALNLMKIIDGAYRSAATGRPVKV